MTESTPQTTRPTPAERARWVESMRRLCPHEDRLALARALLPAEFAVVPRDPMPEVVAAWWRTKNGGYPWAPVEDRSDYAAYRAVIAAAEAADA